MTDRPILMSAPMVRALLDGRKTQTRRLAWREVEVDDVSQRVDDLVVCPTRWPFNLVKRPTIWQSVKPGDRLWVRETWNLFVISQDGDESWPSTQIPEEDPRLDEVRFHQVIDHPVEGLPGSDGGKGPWRPSIHMPRWASRLTLLVTATKMEGLLDISREDARAEGFASGRLDDGFGPKPFGDTGLTIESPGTLVSEVGAFQIGWKSLHPDWDGYSSPEVVALTFTVHQQNIDAMEAA